MDAEERQRKLEAGRAKKPSTMPRGQPLASYRERRAKGDGAGAPKKTAKRKGQNVPKTDRPAQERPLEATAPTGDARENGGAHQHPEVPFTVHHNQSQKNPSQRPGQGAVPSPMDQMEDELIALTGKEQLQQLQQAVEKRNEIIAKLSLNLQEAQASRDQVQQEAASLAGQIQALQKQLQKTSADFLRSKAQTGAPPSQQSEWPPGCVSPSPAPCWVELPPAEEDLRTASLLSRLRVELDEERRSGQRLCEELEEEKERCQRVLGLLETERREREEEVKRQEAETELRLRDLQEQMGRAQSQSSEIQRYKEEKELLNAELQEATGRLEREKETAERLKEELALSARHLCHLEEEKERREEETRRLEEEHRGELDRIRQLLEEGEKEIDKLEKEDSGIKASKDRRNRERASFGPDDEEEDQGGEGGPDREEDSEEGLTVAADLLMERYLTSAHPPQSTSSLADQSFEEPLLADETVSYSFELNSEVLGDPSHLFSISNPLREEYDGGLLHSAASSDCVQDRSPSAGWPVPSPRGGAPGEFWGQEPADLAKQLLGQQCEELREELDLKEKELDVLRDEVSKSAEDLEEARSRWAQVTEELKAALWELEEEKRRTQNLEEEEQKTERTKEETTFQPSQQDASEAQLVQRSQELDSALMELSVARLRVQAAQEELEELGRELEESRRSLGSAEEQRSRLEEELRRTVEEARDRAGEATEAHRLKEEEKERQLRRMEQILEEELEQFEELIQEKDEELAQVREKWEEEQQEKQQQLLGVKRLLEEQRREREAEVEALKEEQALALEELRRCHRAEVEEISGKHGAEVSELDGRLERELSALRDEHKRQVGLIKQVTEREHQRMLSELSSSHREELGVLRLELPPQPGGHDTGRQAEHQQQQQLEALRLSLAHLHSSRLEESHANMEREREAQLRRVQAELRDKWTGENAILQAKQQFELDRLRQQNLRDLDALRQQLEGRLSEEKASMELNRANEIQVMRSQWEEERDRSTAALQTLLSEAQRSLEDTQTSLEELRASGVREVRRLEEDLNLAWADRDAASGALENLVNTHKTVLKEKEVQWHQLEEREEQLKQQVSHLQEELSSLKTSSEQEVGDLWAQLESMRSSRQELGELREQLVARSSRVEDLERLKAEFSDQRRDIKRHNEEELDSLRRYFEQRLRAAEESYREEIALLQLRLVEGALEDSLLHTGDASLTPDGEAAEEKSLVLAEISLKLEQHKEELDSLRLQLEEKHEEELLSLRSSLSLSHREELLTATSDLAARYRDDLETMETRHALDLEQLRGRLSENHVGELTQLGLEWARQVEVEVEQRLWSHSEELHSSATLVQTLQGRLRSLETLQRSTQQLKEDSAEGLTGRHAQELAAAHALQLDALAARHRQQLAAAAAELDAKHTALLVAVETGLDAKWRAEAEAMQEAHRAQREALEAELAAGHAAQRDELETRMLSNMDTLEAAYLKEVQALRDDMERLEDAHAQEVERLTAARRQEVEQLKTARAQEGERLRGAAAAGREELRAELAQMHMAKFSAMATELSNAHKEDLSAQKEALDAEHCKALEALKTQVLELEEQHGCALEELSSACSAEKLQLSGQQRQQLQELRSSCTREMEACRRELQEESSRQQLQFQEQMRLLKGQSEERLQDGLGNLKAELEQCKEAELEEQRRSFGAEREQKERGYTDKMSQLTAQLQQLDGVVAQLRAEVGGLQGELEGKRAEMETLDSLLQRRERESQEGGTLLSMLGQDLQGARQDGLQLHQANEKLRTVLLDVIRSTVATEELIAQKINVGPGRSQRPANHRSPAGGGEAQESGVPEGELSQDLDLTQRLCESLLVSEAQLHPAGEQAALGACGRLRQAVDALLDLLNQANAQVEQAHSLHLSLEQRFTQGRQDASHALQKHTVLLEQLDQEAGLKTQLHVELHKAEGLLDGYVTEKALLEEALQQKESQEERLAEELEGLRVQLHQTEGLTAELEGLRAQLHQAEGLTAELEGLRAQLRRTEGLTAELDHLRAQHQELGEEHAVLLRQREHLSAGLGEREKALLEEAQRLAQERLDLQRQAEKDRHTLSLRLRTLEAELEERETKGLETELHHRAHSEDLYLRVQALEKQIKHDRQFIHEQAVEREHERDEFQQEIQLLEAQVRQTSRVPGGADHRGQRIEDLFQQVESLQALVKDKTEDNDALMAAHQQAQRSLAEGNDEIDKLAARVRDLEQTLVHSAEAGRTLAQLEQEVQRARVREQGLTQDKLGLEQQQLSNKLQIAALQSKLDESRHYHDDAPDPTQPLRDALDTAQLSLQSRGQEVETLMSQLDQVQANLSLKEVELKHLALQLELVTNQNAAHVQQLQDKISSLEDNVSALAVLQEERDEKREEDEEEEEEEESLPSALLQEKNQEIDQLNQEIRRLEVELETSESDLALRGELEELRCGVEHLRCEVGRLRQDKREEEERLHEVISTLQAQLNTLGPALHELTSDSQEGDSAEPSPAPSPGPPRGAPGSLRQELRLTPDPPPARRAMQARLETAAAEKEALEQLLLAQEEEYRSQSQELGRRLREERERAGELGALLAQKEAELEEATARALLLEGERQEEEEALEERRRAEVLEAAALRGETERLRSRVEEQTEGREEREEELEELREANAELQGRLQQSRLLLEALEVQVSTLEVQVSTLQTAKAELSSEQEALRRREAGLQEEMEGLRQEVVTQKALIQRLGRSEAPEKDRRETLTPAALTPAGADVDLREKEAELARLSAEQRLLRAELAAVKEGLCSSTERADKLQEEGQTKDRALADLETFNGRLKEELRGLQEDLAEQEEELAYQQRELHLLRQSLSRRDADRQEHQNHQDQRLPQKALSQGGFEDLLGESRAEASLSSPEVLRRQECPEERTLEAFCPSVLRGSRLSELSALDSTARSDLPPGRASPHRRSRTLTPESVSRSTRSPGSASASDNFSMACSLDVDKMDPLDLSAPPSPAGSASSLSAPEWASDGYGSNVSSELGVRLRAELEHTERLDAQFVEYLRCRGMNPAPNTDSAAGSMSLSDELLSPELQEVLKKVHHESCRILTLSQRHAPSSSSAQHLLAISKVASLDRELCPSPDGPAPMGWQREKRALQETVVALRELLCRVAQRGAQSDPGGRVEEKEVRGEELEETQRQLSASQTAQQEQRNALQTLRLSLQGAEEALQTQQNRVQELQDSLDQERALTLRREREDEDRREVMRGQLEQRGSEAVALRGQLEQQGSEAVALRGQLEQQAVASSNLRGELQIEQSRSGLLQLGLADAQRLLQEEAQCSSRQQELLLQERGRAQRLLAEAEARLEQETRRQEADREREASLLQEVRAQLEQERRQTEELAAAAQRLRAELLQAKRRGEEAREEAGRLGRALEEQKREACCALAAGEERGARQDAVRAALEEQLRAVGEEERGREEQRRKDSQKHGERERRQERTKLKLCELELLREKDQRQLKELQETLTQLQKEQKEMAAHRARTSGTSTRTSSTQSTEAPPRSQQVQQLGLSSGLVQTLMEENAQLTERVASLSRERETLRHSLAALERQLRRAQHDLAAADPAEAENRPAASDAKAQRLYERYLRAESFRKSLVYQKRYLVLLLGGFQECEQATLCLIASMGARPSHAAPPRRRRPLARFRAVVCAVIAVSRMKFLTRKWQHALRRKSWSGGQTSGGRLEVLRLQRYVSEASPPTRDGVPLGRDAGSLKTPLRAHNRACPAPAAAGAPVHSGTSQDPERSLSEYIHHLEKVQRRLAGSKPALSALHLQTKKSEH